MTDPAARAIASLVSAGWAYDPAPPLGVALPAPLAGASDALLAWASSFSGLSSSDDAVWFLGLREYVAHGSDDFAWNAFETLSFEAAVSESERSAITEYWSAHRPILLSVRGEYSYLAERADGAIVHGVEPEFEESTVVAESIESLLASLAGPAQNQHALVEELLFGHAGE